MNRPRTACAMPGTSGAHFPGAPFVGSSAASPRCRRRWRPLPRAGPGDYARAFPVVAPCPAPPMARIRIELPERFAFSTAIPLLISHINYGNHLDNAQLLGVVSEARLRFLKSMGYGELDVEGVGIIVADAALQYRSEAFHGETMQVEMAATDSANTAATSCGGCPRPTAAARSRAARRASCSSTTARAQGAGAGRLSCPPRLISRRLPPCRCA